MPTAVLDVVDAYRTDLTAASRSEPFGERDETLILFGSILQRALALPSDARGDYLGAALPDVLPTTIREIDARGPDPSMLVSLVEELSEDAEDAGAFSLALVQLDLGRSLTPLGDVRHQGRLVIRQARIHRKLGKLDAALRLYTEVERLGVEHADEELVCRGWLGKGIVARMRGNYPQAAEFFRRVLDSGRRGDWTREVTALAHHGMMIVAEVGKDYDAAVKHGWAAYDLFSEMPTRQADLLIGLSHLCNVTRQYRAALNGFLLVLARALAPRVRLTAIAGAATAAAHLGDAAVVNRLAAEGCALIDARNNQYEVADLERELADAYYWLGDVEQGSAFKTRALDRARAGGYFEIVHAAEALGPHPTSTSEAYTLSAEAHAFTARLAGRDSDDLLGAALNRSD
jgi:tetratricopeptide (TPR) repeat protein